MSDMHYILAARTKPGISKKVTLQKFSVKPYLLDCLDWSVCYEIYIGQFVMTADGFWSNKKLDKYGDTWFRSDVNM